MRGALLIVEAALAVMLLVGAGLLIRSFVRLVQVDAGYDPTNVLVARVHLPGGGAPDQAQHSAQFADALLERVRRAPGVVAAGIGNMTPFGASSYLSGFRFPARDSGEPIMARALEYGVTPGYAEALGLRLQEGRFLTEQDAGAGTQAVLVNQEFVQQYLPSGPVAGRRFGGYGSERRTTAIVGVVGNVLKDGLDVRPQPEIYLVQRFSEVIPLHLVVRTAGNPLALIPVVRGFVSEIDRNAAIDQITPLARTVAASVSQPRFAASVLTAFATVALALAGVGLYGVLSYSVSQRRRELGVRAALGATRRDLLRLVVGQGLALVGAGMALGLAGAAALARLMTNVLFGITPHDALAFATAPLLLLVIAFAACLLPGRRAASADPAEALRCE
jgi:predicted permease